MSLILPKVFASFREEGMALEDVAEALQIEPEEIDSLVFRLMLVGVQGGAAANTNSSRRAALRVVK
jgi:hypothetical protein